MRDAMWMWAILKVLGCADRGAGERAGERPGEMPLGLGGSAPLVASFSGSSFA